MKAQILFASTALSIASCSANTSSINPNDFYAPKVYSDQATLTISIPVEVGEKNGKKSFVKLFELYGFSGNGPSIEQVVKRNMTELSGTFDSEGDAFVVRVATSEQLKQALQKMKCVEDVKCLATWLKKSESICSKE
jgi:hypothetical protein